MWLSGSSGGKDLGFLMARGRGMSQEGEVTAKDGGGNAGCAHGNPGNPGTRAGALGSLRGSPQPDHC